MAKQKFGLGRGLDALISGASDVLSAQQQTTKGESQIAGIPTLPIESILPNPRQPRRIFREDDPRLLELSASIKEHGLIQPIVVMRLHSASAESAEEAMSHNADAWFAADASAEHAGDKPTPSDATVHYQIIAGERRWRAARLAGLHEVAVVIKDVTPQQMLEMALIENIQRADLNPIEEALAYQALIEEYGLTQEMVAKQVGKDRSTITNSLRLLQLTAAVREMLMHQGEYFSEGHARALIGIAHEEDQVAAMNQIIALRLNVRQAEELATRIKASENIEAAIQHVSTPTHRSPEMEALETHFRHALMVKVDLKCNAKGKGTLVLHFNDQEELEGLYHRLLKNAE